jgi:hypothetical protein
MVLSFNEIGAYFGMKGLYKISYLKVLVLLTSSTCAREAGCFDMFYYGG